MTSWDFHNFNVLKFILNFSIITPVFSVTWSSFCGNCNTFCFLNSLFFLNNLVSTVTSDKFNVFLLNKNRHVKNKQTNTFNEIKVIIHWKIHLTVALLGGCERNNCVWFVHALFFWVSSQLSAHWRGRQNNNKICFLYSLRRLGIQHMSHMGHFYDTFQYFRILLKLESLHCYSTEKSDKYTLQNLSFCDWQKKLSLFGGAYKICIAYFHLSFTNATNYY